MLSEHTPMGKVFISKEKISVGSYGVADTIEKAKEKLSKMKAYLANKKEEVVYQE